MCWPEVCAGHVSGSVLQRLLQSCRYSCSLGFVGKGLVAICWVQSLLAMPYGRRLLLEWTAAGGASAFSMCCRSTHMHSCAEAQPNNSCVALTTAACVCTPSVQDHMANRQDGPHTHCVVFHPSYNWVFVPDLGDNAIHQYGYKDGRLTAQCHVALPPGEGPRHFVFHPKLPVAYSGCELLSRVQVGVVLGLLRVRSASAAHQVCEATQACAKP